MTEPETNIKSPGKWRRRIRITILLLLFLVAAGRLAMGLVLPTVIRKVANAYDLDCTYGRLKLSVLGGTADVWNLVLRPKAGGESIVVTDYIHGNISPLNLLRGRLVVWRAEVDGVNVLVDRDADGSIPLLKKILPAATTQPAAPVVSSEGNSAKQINLEAPLFVEAVRVSHVIAKFRDRSVTPTFEATLKTNLRVTDVGSPSNPLQFEMDVGFEPLLDTLYVTGQAKSTPTSLDVDGTLLMRGLHLKAASAYLLPFGLKPVGNEWTMQASVSLNAKAIEKTPDFTANVRLTNVSAAVDEQPFGALTSLTLNAKQLNATAAQLGTLVIDGATLSLRRTDAGVLQCGGIELLPMSSAPTTPRADAADVAGATSQPSPFKLSLDELAITGVEASFSDDFISPAARVVAHVNQFGAKGISTDASAVPFSALFGLPGLVKTVSITGTLDALAPTKRLTLQVKGAGFKPDAAGTYLSVLGLESQLDSASFSANVDAGVSLTPAGVILADGRVWQIHFDDGATPLLDFASAQVSGVSFDPITLAVGVKDVQLSGPTLSVRRDPEGRLAALGFRTKPRATRPAAATVRPPNSATSEPANPSPAIVLPRLEVGHFSWRDIKLSLADESRAPVARLTLGDAGLEVDDLLIDLKSDAGGRKPGQFHAWMSLPAVVDRFDVTGTLVPEARRFVADLTIVGTGLSGGAIAPYLKAFGIVPVLKSGAISLQTKAALTQTDGGLGVSLDVSAMKLTDGADELLGVDVFRLGGFEVKPAKISVGELTMKRPRTRVTRNVDGTFEAAGVRIVPVPTTKPATPVVVEADNLHLIASPIKASLKSLHVEAGSIDWIDLAVQPPVRTRATADVHLTDAQLGDTTNPATFKLNARVDGVIDSASVDGTLTLAPDAPAAKVNVSATGIRAGPLVSYLPPNVEVLLKDGSFKMALDVHADNNAAGGLTAAIGVSGLQLSDGATQWAKLDAFTLNVPRVDPAAGVFDVAEISSKGVSAEVRKTNAGDLEAAGVRLTSGRSAPAGEPSFATTQPSDAGPVDVAQLIAAARKPLPHLSIGKIDFGVDELRMIGFTGVDAAPIVLSGVRVEGLAPISLGGPDSESLPPVRLKLSGGVRPVVSAFDVTLDATPLASEPSVSVDVSATGISGRGLTDLLPALRPIIDGSELATGSFKTHVDAAINYGRRGPRDLDVSRGFNAGFSIKPVEFRAAPGGPVLAGLDEIRGDQIKVEPKSGNVTIKSVEITKPTGRFYRDAQGIHGFGLVLPLAPSKTVEEATAPGPATAPVEAEAMPATTPSVVAHPMNELRLDRLTISGVDVVVEDRTSKPFTIIPLKTLDVEVRDVSNQMPWTGKPMRFTMLCTSDKVALPARKGAHGVATTSPADGEGYLEDRDLFSQVAASGRIGVKQNGEQMVLDGWAKTSVNGFELLGVRGLAEQYGVKIGGGVFDYSNDVRFRPEGMIETKNKVVFTNLSLSEPADGPLRRVFKLPAPIDVAIGAVTDPDGSITMNLPIPIKNGTIKAGDVVGPAVGAVAGVLVTGIASAPIKAIGGIGDLLGGGKKAAREEVPVVVSFLPGYGELEGSGRASVQALVERLVKEKDLEVQLRHEMTSADVDRAGVRANPSPADCAVLAARVRVEKDQLLSRRAVLVAQARGDIGSRSDEQAGQAIARLREVDQQLARAENSLDQLYDLMRPGSESQAERRTRSACLDIARERLERVRDVLVKGTLANADQRVHLTNPQYDPTESTGGGRVVLILVPKRK